jgi:hypothetical protein
VRGRGRSIFWILIASDCAVDELERTLEGRLAGVFEPLEGDWKERVRQSAAKLG